MLVTLSSITMYVYTPSTRHNFLSHQQLSAFSSGSKTMYLPMVSFVSFCHTYCGVFYQGTLKTLKQSSGKKQCIFEKFQYSSFRWSKPFAWKSYKREGVMFQIMQIIFVLWMHQKIQVIFFGTCVQILRGLSSLQFLGNVFCASILVSLFET